MFVDDGGMNPTFDISYSAIVFNIFTSAKPLDVYILLAFEDH